MSIETFDALFTAGCLVLLLIALRVIRRRRERDSATDEAVAPPQ